MRFSSKVIALLLLTAVGAEASEREARLAAGEIMIETTELDGVRLPRADAYAVIDAPVERIQHFLEDCRNYPGRIPGVEEAKLVKQEGDDFYCRITVDMPFPFSNLVATTKATHTKREGYFRREWTLVEGDYERSDGAWTLTRFRGQRNRTLAHYWLLSVPDVPVPDVLLGYVQRTSLPEIMESVRREVQKAED